MQVNETKRDEENVHTYDNGFHPKPVHLKSNYRIYRTNIFYRFFNKVAIVLFIIMMFIPKRLFWGFKVVGRKNSKELNGSIVLSNHTHPYDVFSMITAIPTKRLYITMLESNLGFGIVSHVFRIGGAVPIPTPLDLQKKFNSDTTKIVDMGYNVLFFPEAALMPFCDHIRPFMPGAFHYVYNSKNRKIVPTMLTYHEPKGFYKLTRRHAPCIHYNILEPYYMKDLGNKRDSINKAKDDLHKIMSDYFIAHSDYYYDKDGNKIRDFHDLRYYTKKKKK